MMDYFYYTYKHNHIELSSHIYKVSTYHYNWHDEVEILVLLKGKMEMSCKTQVFTMEPMDAVIISPQAGHATLALEPDTVAIVMHIGKDYFKYFDDTFNTYSFVIHSSEETRYNHFYLALRAHIASMMLLQLKEEQPLNRLMMENHFTGLMSDVYKEILDNKEESNIIRSKDQSSATFDKMIAYIGEKYQHKIELEDIARIGGYNVSYASQFFKRQMGISFVEYLLRLRLREATVRLVNSDEAIARIANRVGFADIKAFNVAFKKQFHITPSEYRNLAKEIGRQTKLYDWKEMVSTDSSDVINILETMVKPSTAITNEPVDESIDLNQYKDNDGAQKKLDLIKVGLESLLKQL